MRPSGSGFLHVFKTRVLYFLDNLGVISVNNVICAVSNFVSRLEHVIDVEQDFNVQYNIY